MIYRPVSLRAGRLLFVFVLIVLFVVSLGGLFSYEKLTNVYYRQNLFPASTIIEATLLIICAVGIKRMYTPTALLVSVVLVVYVLLCINIFYLRAQGSEHILDFFLIFKSIIYLAILSICSNNLFSAKDIRTIFRLLVLFFLAKYIIAKFLFGIERPGLFTENNFELLMLLMLYGVLEYNRINIGSFYRISLYAIILLSGSLSGIGSLLVLLIFIFPTKSVGKKLIKLGILSVILTIAIAVMALRFQSVDALTTLDRLVFVGVFIEEVGRFNILDIMFGTNIITPLTQNSCSSLAFYTSLFSAGDSSVCYSVVLHSFVLRAIFDHGIAGFLVMLYLAYYLVMRAYCDKKIAILIVGLALLNGLSVSSLNNTFFAFAMVLIIGASASIKQHEKVRKLL